MDSKEFHVPKRLASARLPYVKTYLGSAFAHEGPSMPRIELGIEAPAKALDSLLGIITGGRQYFEDWWDKNDYGGSLELIKVADFLGCTELVQIIEDLLIKELQVGKPNHGVFCWRCWNHSDGNLPFFRFSPPAFTSQGFDNWGSAPWGRPVGGRKSDGVLFLGFSQPPTTEVRVFAHRGLRSAGTTLCLGLEPGAGWGWALQHGGAVPLPGAVHQMVWASYGFYHSDYCVLMVLLGKVIWIAKGANRRPKDGCWWLLVVP